MLPLPRFYPNFKLMESKEFNFKSLIDLVMERWLILLLVAIAGIAVGTIISMPVFMKPRFKSVAVVYPVNTVKYGDESETEQLLQVFESSSVRDSIIDRFDLYERYGIERGAPQSRFFILEEFNDRVVVQKTMYESVRLEVSDEDPQLAKDMASEMLKLVNQKFNQLANVRGRNLADSYKKQLDMQAAVMDSVEDLVRLISTEKGLLDYEAQSRELVRGYIEASKGGNGRLKDELEEWMAKAQEGGSMVKMLQTVNEFAAESRADVEEKFLFWNEFAYRNINYIDVIVEPEVADKKAWPVRWLVVAISTGAALLMAIVLIALGNPKMRSEA